MQALRIAVFAALLIFCVTPWASPPIALAIGLALALTIGHPFASRNSKATKLLLQTSVILLGFGMNLQKVVDRGLEEELCRFRIARRERMAERQRKREAED